METTLVSSGNFAIVLGPVDESCVRGQDVYLGVEVSADAAVDGYTPLPGRQRIYAASSAATSGAGDFAVQGTLTANTLDVSATAVVDGNLSSGGQISAAANVVAAQAVLGEVGLGGFFAGFKHRDAPVTSSYALLQSGDGLATFLNAGPGGELFFRTNNTNRATLDSAGTFASGPGIAPGASERLRIVRGTVNANGSPNRGAGYSSFRPTGGVFDVVFSPPFSGPPTVLCNTVHPTVGNQVGGSGGCMPGHPNNVTANGFRAVVTSGDNNPANFPFSFIAIGPG